MQAFLAGSILNEPVQPLELPLMSQEQQKADVGVMENSIETITLSQT